MTPSAASSAITGISLLDDPAMEASDFADILIDRVIRGLIAVVGVTKVPFGLPFSARGLEGQADILRLFLPRLLTLPSCAVLLVLLLPSLGVFFRRDRVVMIVCGSSGFSSMTG